MHVREQADVLSPGMPVRAAVPPAQAARLRPVQRLSWNILRLVQVPVVLRVPLLRSTKRPEDHVPQSPHRRRRRKQQRPRHVVPKSVELLTFTFLYTILYYCYNIDVFCVFSLSLSFDNIVNVRASSFYR